MPWPVIALVAVTTANYAWQVPYFVHFYGESGHAPGGLTVPLLFTFVWFAGGIALLVTRRRGAAWVLSAYLVLEALFYLVHNSSGAFGRDLPTSDPVLFVASVLGYVNAVAAVSFLVWLRRRRNLLVPAEGTEQPGGLSPVDLQPPSACSNASTGVHTAAGERRSVPFTRQPPAAT